MGYRAGMSTHTDTDMDTRHPAHPRLAVVTGADSGMGKAIAELLASEGFDVGITFHTDESGAEDTRAAVEERGQRCFVTRQDQSEPDTGGVVDELAEQLGGLGVLVNNAGSGHRDRVLDLDYETWRHVLATDLDGPFLCSKHAAKLMRDAGHGGRIINITSVHEHVPPSAPRRTAAPRPGSACTPRSWRSSSPRTASTSRRSRPARSPPR